MYWYMYVLKNCFDFQGRASREEYWMFFLVNMVVTFVVGILDAMWGKQLLSLVYMALIFFPSLAVGIRRLHDTDRSGWWQLIGLIPLLGMIVLLVFYALPSTPGDNRFGEGPID